MEELRTMEEFTICKVKSKEYGRFLICLTFYSIMDYLQSVEKTLGNYTGKLLIDQLLLTGNGKNRFLSCDVLNGKLDFSTARLVNPDEQFSLQTVDFLRNNYCYVENSILTEEERRKIRNGIAF